MAASHLSFSKSQAQAPAQSDTSNPESTSNSRRMSLSKSLSGVPSSYNPNLSGSKRSSRYAVRRSVSSDQHLSPNAAMSSTRDGAYVTLPHTILTPIPGSPYATEASSPSPSKESFSTNGKENKKEKYEAVGLGLGRNDASGGTPDNKGVRANADTTPPRSRPKSSQSQTKYISYRGAPPQSLDAMAELLALAPGHSSNSNSIDSSPTSSHNSSQSAQSRQTAPQPISPSRASLNRDRIKSKDDWRIQTDTTRISEIGYAASASTPNLHLQLHTNMGNGGVNGDGRAASRSGSASGASGLFFAASDSIPSTPVSAWSVRTMDGRVTGVMGEGGFNGLPPPPPSPSIPHAVPTATTGKGRRYTILAPKGVKATISTPILDHGKRLFVFEKKFFFSCHWRMNMIEC